MKVHHIFKHLDRSESLESFVEERLTNLEQFLLRESAVQVFYSRQKEAFCTEIMIHSREKYFKSTDQAQDIYAAVTEAINKLERQILKVRKINQHHKKYKLSKRGKMDSLNERFEKQSSRWRRAA